MCIGEASLYYEFTPFANIKSALQSSLDSEGIKDVISMMVANKEHSGFESSQSSQKGVRKGGGGWGEGEGGGRGRLRIAVEKLKRCGGAAVLTGQGGFSIVRRGRRKGPGS